MSKKQKRRGIGRAAPPETLSPYVRNLAQQFGAEVRTGMSGQEKMSDVLLDFAEPFLDHSEPLDAQLITVNLAVLAWNYALSAPERQRRFMEAADAPFHTLQERLTFEQMVRRKAESFPENRRMFIEVQVVDQGAGLVLRAITTPADEEGAPG